MVKKQAKLIAWCGIKYHRHNLFVGELRCNRRMYFA